MGTYHMDKEVEAAYIRLNDALCSWERATDRGATLILIPHMPDEDIQVSIDGKPAPHLTMLGAADFADTQRVVNKDKV